MNELVPFASPQLNTEIRVEVLPAESQTCAVHWCRRPYTYAVFYLSRNWSRLNCDGVCFIHARMLQRSRAYPCLVFPADDAPPLEAITAAVNQEILSRRAASRAAWRPATDSHFFHYSSNFSQGFTFHFGTR